MAIPPANADKIEGAGEYIGNMYIYMNSDFCLIDLAHLSTKWKERQRNEIKQIKRGTLETTKLICFAGRGDQNIQNIGKMQIAAAEFFD